MMGGFDANRVSLFFWGRSLQTHFENLIIKKRNYLCST